MALSAVMHLRTPTPDQAALLTPHLPAAHSVIHAVLDGERLAGGLALSDLRPGTSQLSCWVVPEERRRGVATRAVRALCRATRERLELVTDITDTVSQRVALNAGFTRETVRREGRLRDGVRRDEVVFAWLPGDPPGPAARPLPALPGGALTDGEVSVRPLCPADVDDLLALLNRPDVRARAISRHERTRTEIERRCAAAESEWLAGVRADLTIRVNDEFAGDIGLYNEALSRQAMIGYSMEPGFRGRGVATRAVRLLSAWAFEIGVRRLVAGTMVDNVASQRVLEKAGFVREGIQRSRFVGPDGAGVDDVMHVLFPARG
jgi:RimJ/RimL family protein N-acetyltransferase